MGKKIFIDGNFLLKTGVFYTLDFIMNANESFREAADEIINCNDAGVYEITEDGGSMFNFYYVKGGITMYGGNGSTIMSFKKECERTVTKYVEIRELIAQLLEEAKIPEKCRNIFYQQQYISLFANLEYFLYNTFMWETCQCYESYQKVINTHFSFLEYKDAKSILRGEHNILQERTFVEQVKHAIYHNVNQVGKLYKAAFEIDVDLNLFLEKELQIRHDIVHRAGFTKEELPIPITKEDVIALKNKIDCLTDEISLKIKDFKRKYD